MKEFHSNNFSLHLCSDNSALYLALKEKLEEYHAKENFLLLRDMKRVYTRENLTIDYLSLKLVEDNIPSLLFEINPYRTIPREFLKKQSSSENIISDLACILLIENILSKKEEEVTQQKKKDNGKKSISLNKKVLRQLATSIFQFWKDSLISYSLKEEKIPNNIKQEYDSIIRKFLKTKGSRKIEFEYLYEACASGKSSFISENEAKEKFGEEIIFYGISEIDPLHFKILEILSSYIKITFLIPAPRIGLIHETEKIENAKLKELIPEWHILNRLLGDKKKADLEELLQFSIPEIPSESSLHFYESQEAYREIEFVAREILRLIEDNKEDENFRLTSIKLVLPAEDLNYSLLVSNTFDRMGIPYSFTKDIRKKKSPYFSAVASLLKLSISDFDKESIFSLFYNPCFFPVLEEMRISVKPDVWNQIISKMNLSGYLDKEHKKKLGYRESNLMTWENLWKRLNLILIGDRTGDSAKLDSQLMEEVYEFLEVSSSLLHDLIGLKEDFSKLSDFAKFFKIILDTYLHPSMRYNQSDEAERLNERGKSKINNFLSSIESIDFELDSLMEDKPNYSLEDFVDILLTQMEAWTEGDSRVLKNGVVVGELLDVIDPSFDYVFLVGLDERRFSNRSTKHDTVMIEDSIQSLRLDSALKLKTYFYHIFNHKAQRYTFSYVSLDTIRDREYYPARELDKIFHLSNSKDAIYKKIPLFSYLEYKMEGNKTFERETFDLISYKQKEMSLPFLKTSYPNWLENSNPSLSKEIDLLTSNKQLNQKVKSYFFRSSVDTNHSSLMQSNKISARKFIHYLECPKKFFYKYSVHTEEESEVTGEIESIDSLQRSIFIREALTLLSEDRTLSAQAITEKVFSRERVEWGELPFGVLGKVARQEFIEYLESSLLPFFNGLLEKFEILKKPVFNKEANKTLNSVVFSSPILWDEPVKADADFLFQDGDNLYLTILVTGKKGNDQNKKILASFISFLINQSDISKNEIKDYFGLASIQIRPAILYFPTDKNPEFSPGENCSNGDMFKPFWESLFRNEYPAFPITGKKDSCEHCQMRTVCHAYQTDFIPFLESEMQLILSEVKEQFSSKSESKEAKGKSPSKKKNKKN